MGTEIGRLTAVRESTFTVRRAMLIDDGENPLRTALAGRPAMAFVSPTVDRLYGARIRARLADVGTDPVMVVPTGEPSKVLATVQAIVERANGMRFSRRGVFLGIGGGILLDTVGLAASLFRRGVPHIKIGTTLVAQVDAAIGIKNGVNADGTKNLVGAFMPPELVLTDGAFLATLGIRQVRCGLAEMIKLAVTCDEGLFALLESHGRCLFSDARDDDGSRSLIDSSIKGMLAELQRDPYEIHLQRRVDFGHTVSPSLESSTAFSVLHGEAVSIDLAYFCVVSNLMGLLGDDDLHRILALQGRLGLPRWHDRLEQPGFISHALSATEAHRGMRLHLPLPVTIGSTCFLIDRADLPDGLLHQAVKFLRAL
jgi:2-epi-5-epi-valiolone synthase